MSYQNRGPWADLRTNTLLSDGTSISTAQIAIYSTLSLLSAYYILQRMDLIPALSIFELTWNTLVYITPSSLVMALDNRAASSLDKAQDNSTTYSQTRTFAAKSEAMRRIVGMDGTGIATRLQRTRAFSGVGSLLKGQPSDSLPGLGNLDNSCYQNSIIQGLASLPALPEFLRSMQDCDNVDRDSSMTIALGEIIHQLNDPENSGQRLWTPAVLKNMSSWTQQDAQEYFSKILDDLEKEASKNTKKRTLHEALDSICKIGAQSSREHDQAGPDPIQPLCDKTIPTTLNEASVSVNPLEGLLAQRVGCLRCGYVEGLSLIPFNCITLPLGDTYRSVYRLADCLDKYTDLEKIEEVECGRCTLLRQKEQLLKINAESRGNEGLLASIKGRLGIVEDAIRRQDFSESTISGRCQVPKKARVSSTKTRQAVIARSPNSLVLHVNRSIFDETTFVMTKNNARVTFPDILDLSAWCLGRSSHDDREGLESWNEDPNVSLLAGAFKEADSPKPTSLSGLEYSLRAIIIHQGRHENGHYISYRRDPVDSGRWWRLSDETVYSVSQDQVLFADGVYMLFYERLSTISEEPTTVVGEDRAAEAPIAEQSCETTIPSAQMLEKSAILSRPLRHVEPESLSNAESDLAPKPATARAQSPMPDTPSRTTEAGIVQAELGTIGTAESDEPKQDELQSSDETAKPVAPPMRTAGMSKKRSKRSKQRGMPGMSNMVAAN